MTEAMDTSPERQKLTVIETALTAPIPNMNELRERKKGYNELPIDTTDQRFNEPIVDIASYDIAGQAYYSRPNNTTKEPLPGVPQPLFLRKSVVETLAELNAALTNPIITKFFGGEVELYVEDALRPVALQTRLYEDLVPALIRHSNPDMSEEQVLERRKDMIAIPSTDPNRPSPHATGGALDIGLRFKQSTPMFVEGSYVPMGHVDGDTSERINPDFFEQNAPENEVDRLAQRNRRAYYAIMIGSAFGIDTGFVNNPTEWWHWGKGDQLSAKVSDESAYYSFANSRLQ